ncbi:MAG: hypothetical protein LBE83_05285 [Propionibacteriaceae bacterium]|nr:hypothetical protein [Propionibacteriaceae bacterium]
MVLGLVLAATSMGGCTAAKPGPSQPTRVAITDQLADSPLFQALQSVTFSDTQFRQEYVDPRFAGNDYLKVNEIRTPVAIIIYQPRHDPEWAFAQTDLFDTVQDLDQANTVLFVSASDGRVEWRYNVYLTDQALLSVYQLTSFSNKEQSPDEADYAFFTKLANQYTFSETASNQLSSTVHLFQGMEIDNPDVLSAVGSYDYPQSDQLKNHPGALAGYRGYISTNLNNVPSNNDPSDYVREASALATIPATFHLGSYELADWQPAARGEPYLLTYYERTGVKSIGRYYGTLYAYVHRATYVDALTGQIVAWEEGHFDFTNDPPERAQYEDDEYGRAIYHTLGKYPPPSLAPPFD